ncbi:class I SAM-dependent methyltransferase, partial [Candidatus Parcubacteria bacterium]|nr:class I SAM-dependent methyltransferase [Candidatus Parcubacteria bacterium]
MKYINCPICGENNTEILFVKKEVVESFTNVICKNCSLVYINPCPSKDEFDEFYHEKFLSMRNITSVMQVKSSLSKRDLKIKQTVYSFLKEHIKDGQNILDIGCGYGTLLNILRKKEKVNVYGIELGDLRVKVAKEIYDFDLFHDSLEKFVEDEKNHKKFDIIIMHHSLEHMSDPLKALGQVNALLREGGFLYIAVPNVMNINKRLEKFFRLAHPFSFSPFSLNLLLQKASFGIIRFNRSGGDPGGMELLAKLNVVSAQDMTEGQQYEEVIKYVESADNKFSSLRKLRDGILFFLPKEIRIKLGRIIYKIIIDWKIIFNIKNK